MEVEVGEKDTFWDIAKQYQTTLNKSISTFTFSFSFPFLLDLLSLAYYMFDDAIELKNKEWMDTSVPGWMFVRADIIEDDADLFESQARNNSFTISSIPLPPSLFILLFSFSLSLSPSLPLSLLSLPFFDKERYWRY